ncbi:uncharacterized protein [Venturia canescens]|uniref:uncharacterized protein n=1 Tax=Venturia canescens TaxID=32260 RepID=UPI001C9CF0FF|nr:uncharacterized protein LOC122412933 [Venturia canescens]
MNGEGVMNTQDSCYGGASIAGAVIGTFLTTVFLLLVAAIVYRQWRRHKGKHLVLVTNPEIVEDAYAFDNPCFKDATPAVNRNHDGRPLSTASLVVETIPNNKDSARWSSPWSSLVFTGASANKNDRRRTLDDSCLGSKATRVSMVSLRSRDFTGLGFNVCGNMREGIFVKDLLHRGPASESGRIHPGDRIASVKISFRSMVYEDALTILSYASPYDVELEVESGGNSTGSRPTTLLKKTVGPSPSRICHPLYRSQSIPELSQAHKTSSKRLFIADPNESFGSNYSTMNSTMKSSKSTPGSQTLERHHEETKIQNNHHHKFGIKVLPALDGTVHRIENQNEHNTNLERRNSRKLGIENEAVDDTDANIRKQGANSKRINHFDNLITERYQKRENSRQNEVPTTRISITDEATHDYDTSEKISTKETSFSASGTVQSSGVMETIDIPTEVPTEVHNAAMAARRNRKNSLEMLLNASKTMSADHDSESSDSKSPHKNKRKAPAPPTVITIDNGIKSILSDKRNNPAVSSKKIERENPDDSIESITDYAESLNDYVGKVRDGSVGKESLVRSQVLEDNTSKRHKTETDSDNDSEIHDSFTTIELKPADITVHHTPLPCGQGQLNGDEVDDDDVYRKAASLGDLSKYENKSLATLERAQSLDMADTGSKKRKLVTPDDIHESTEDLTKIEDMDTFDRRKLKKSNEWGTLEDAIWTNPEIDSTEPKTRTCKRSNGTLERSKSAVEMKLKNEESRKKTTDSPGQLVPIEMADDTSIELYNLPVSIVVTKEFVRTERMFNPDEDNSLALIVNNGKVVKSSTPEEIDSDFRRKTPVISDDDDELEIEEIAAKSELSGLAVNPARDDEFGAALRYFDRKIGGSSMNDENLNVKNKKDDDRMSIDGNDGTENFLYAGKKEVEEKPMRRVTVTTGCPGCDRKHSHHNKNCSSERPQAASNGNTLNIGDKLDWQPQEVSKLPESPTEDDKSMSLFKIGISKSEKNPGDIRSKSVSPIELRIKKKLLREREIEFDDDMETRQDKKNEPTKELRDLVADEDEEGYDFGSNITVNSKIISSPILNRHNVSNVSVSSGENSEDSGLVGESCDYGRQDHELKPPLPNTPIPSSTSQQKLTYITEINLSTNRGNAPNTQQDLADNSIKREYVKPARNEASLTSNGKATGGKKPPVPPRRNDASKMQLKDCGSTDKQVVYVSEYKAATGKDKSENTSKKSVFHETETPKKEDSKKFENWYNLGENK